MESVLRESDDGILVYIAPTKALVTQIAAEVYARFSKNLKGSESCFLRLLNDFNCRILIILLRELLGYPHARLSHSWSAELPNSRDSPRNVGNDAPFSSFGQKLDTKNQAVCLLVFLSSFFQIVICPFNFHQHRVGWDSFDRSARRRRSLGTDSTICPLPNYVRRFLITHHSRGEHIVLIVVYRQRLAHLSNSAIGYQTFRRRMASSMNLFNMNIDIPIFGSSSISSTARRPLRA